MDLREYQLDIIKRLRMEIGNNKKKICVVAPCGSGKSVVLSEIINLSIKKGNRVLFLVHRKELCEQIEETMVNMGVALEFCDIYMVQTATRRVDKIKTPDIIVVDEVHHILSSSYMKIINKFDKSLVLGFTATPCRMNEGGLGKVFESMIESVKVEWLIENKFLAPYKYYGVKLADMGNVKVKQGDYDITEVHRIMEDKYIYGKTLENWKKLALNKKTIIYCSSIVSSIATIEEFVKLGYRAIHLDGSTSKSIRKESIKKFREGEIDILSNVDLFGEGFDVPDCECVILLRPTKSLSLFIQQSMRSMRFKENKTAIIIDHVNNASEHGLPDMDREWSLDTKKKKKGVEPVKTCEKCFCCYHPKLTECPNCGHENESDKKEKQRIEAELEELTKEDFKWMKYESYKQVETFSDMCRFQKLKKYKFGWTIRKCVELGLEVPQKYKYMAKEFYNLEV